ncbi:MAG TPA: alpha/beta hydrolase [Chloroflexota bacterium]|nr:alpha/beta hydrolase [Chloroflexota bacterium]
MYNHRDDLTEGVTAMSIESSFVETTHGRFHIEAAGSGEPVLLIHGGTASAREWRPVIEGLGKHARCVAPDRLGCGLSDRSPRYDRETITESFFALADALGWDRFGVVGQSYGGFWSLSMAFARPARISRMVLVNSAGGPLSEEEIAESLTRRQARPSPPITDAEREAALDRTINTIFADASRIPASFRDDLRWQSERADPAQMQRAGDQFAQMARERYDSIQIPTLVVWGEADAMIPTERGKRLAEAIPGAQYAGLSGVGHTCQIEAPAAFLAVVAPFLDATARA